MSLFLLQWLSKLVPIKSMVVVKPHSEVFAGEQGSRVLRHLPLVAGGRPVNVRNSCFVEYRIRHG